MKLLGRDDLMEALKIQVKCYLDKNKIYITLFLIYVAVMISIMAGTQSEIPFNNVQNFFENNHVIINILMLQATILVLGFFRNNISHMIESGFTKKRAYVGNIINSILFSVISSIFIVGVFCITIAVLNGNSSSIRNLDIYYFGLEVYGINFNSVIKMLMYTFAACIAVMALSNLLALGSKIWSFAFVSGLIALFTFNLFKKSLIVNVVSRFFQWYKAPYIIGIILAVTAIVLFFIGWFLTIKINFKNS